VAGMTNDLTCAELVERITDLMEGAVDAATRRDLLQHLADCDGCQTYAEQFQASLKRMPNRRASLEGLKRATAAKTSTTAQGR